MEYKLQKHLFIILETAVLSPQSCPTLCDPRNCNPPGSSVHGILQARILEWITYSLLQGIFPTQESNRGLLHCRWILYQLNYQGSPLMLNTGQLM